MRRQQLLSLSSAAERTGEAQEECLSGYEAAATFESELTRRESRRSSGGVSLRL
jgi:hypothetical protein